MLASKPPKVGTLTRRGRGFARRTERPIAARVPRLRGTPLYLASIQGLKARPITFPFAYFDYFVVENFGRLGIRKLRVCPHVDFQERGRPRPHQPDTRSYTRFVHSNPAPERSPAGCGQECPRSCTRWSKQRLGSAAVPGRIQPDDRSYTCFDHANPSPDL
ncbi:MAG: hypothetical protein GX456_13695 [Verrucomicrobia bacterium]|nr:hypothetical protein [Verrucomicrobiota bacterium]